MHGTTVNSETLDIYRKKMTAKTREELEDIAAKALYHLQVVCGSRNSFAVSADPNSLGTLVREQIVERMQHEAAAFSREQGA